MRIGNSGENRFWVALGGLALAALLWGCSGSGSGLVLFVDAQFDPATANDIVPAPGVNEANPAVAQTFTVLSSGKFEEFWLVLSQGPSSDSGTIRITVRPVNGAGEPNDDPNTSIIRPIDVDTSTLPGGAAETFTEFFVGDDPGREVTTGQVYAIVVEFVSRASTTDVLEIAIIKGQMANPYADGSGSAGESGVGFTNNTNDYFFRTFVLR